MKRFITLLVGVLLAVFSANSAAASENTFVLLDGQHIDMQTPAVVKEGRTLLGIRDYFTAIGATVDWDDSTRTAQVVVGDKVILMDPDREEIFLNGMRQNIDVAPQILSDRIYVPIRYLSETFGYTVSYFKNPVDVFYYSKDVYVKLAAGIPMSEITVARDISIVHLETGVPQTHLVPLHDIGLSHRELLTQQRDLLYGELSLFDVSGWMMGNPASMYSYYFLSSNGGPSLEELAKTQDEHIKVAGVVTTIGYAFPDAYEGMTLEAFWQMIDVLPISDTTAPYANGLILEVLAADFDFQYQPMLLGDGSIDPADIAQIPLRLNQRIRVFQPTYVEQNTACLETYWQQNM